MITWHSFPVVYLHEVVFGLIAAGWDSTHAELTLTDRSVVIRREMSGACNIGVPISYRAFFKCWDFNNSISTSNNGACGLNLVILYLLSSHSPSKFENAFKSHIGFDYKWVYLVSEGLIIYYVLLELKFDHIYGRLKSCQWCTFIEQLLISKLLNCIQLRNQVIAAFWWLC